MTKQATQYKMEIAISADSDVWFKPSEIRHGWHDVEPSLDFAIKATRYYQRMFGFAVRREPMA